MFVCANITSVLNTVFVLAHTNNIVHNEIILNDNVCVCQHNVCVRMHVLKTCDPRVNTTSASHVSYGVATISMLLKIVGLFCKRAL